MGLRIFIPQPIHPCGLSYLREKGCTLVEGGGSDPDNLSRILEECDGVISKTFFLPTSCLMSTSRLKVIAKHGVGADNIVDQEAAARLGIRVVNTPTANTNSVAEFSLGLVIACAKRFKLLMKLASDDSLSDTMNFAGCDLAGKTLGILGVGHIGGLLAKKAHFGLDMQILGFCRSPKELPPYIAPASSLEQLFSESDFLSLHIPFTKETYGLVGEQLLFRMKPTSYLINTSRGEVIQEKALLRILAEGKIAGAALDVLENEYARSRSPFLSLDNVILTPHSAAMTQEALARMSLEAACRLWEALN